MTATEVWDGMERLRIQFDRDMKTIREKCSHIYSNGRSAFITDPTGSCCNVCWKRIGTNQ